MISSNQALGNHDLGTSSQCSCSAVFGSYEGDIAEFILTQKIGMFCSLKHVLSKGHSFDISKHDLVPVLMDHAVFPVN